MDTKNKPPPLDVRVVEDVKKEDLMCAICLGILNNPKQCKNGHLFCDECISRSIQKNPRCPQCRCNLTESDLSRGLFVEKHLRSLVVYCVNHFQYDEEKKIWKVDAEGCNESHELQLVWNHELHCGYVLCACPFSKQCGKLRKKDLENHKGTCEFRPVECKYCHLDIQAIQLKEHQSICNAVPIPCQLCGLETRRGDMTYHLQKTCPESALACPYGCRDKVLRKEFKRHLKENFEEHLEALRVSQQNALHQLEANYQSEIRRRDKEIQQLRKKVKNDLKIVWLTETWKKVVERGYTQSQKFKLGGCEWYLGLYPNGDDESSRGHVSIYLFLDSKYEEEMKKKHLTVDFRISFINHKSQRSSIRIEFLTTFPVHNGTGWGERCAFKSSKISEETGFLQDDKLLIETDITLKQTILFV